MKLQLENQPEPQAQVPEIIDDNRKAIAEVAEKANQLERILSDVATPERIKKWILDICEAENIKRTADGVEYATPDWDARVKGLDRVMSLLKYNPKDPKITVNNNQPTKIIIQVIDNKPTSI